MKTRTVSQLNQAYGFLPPEPMIPSAISGGESREQPQPPFAVTSDFTGMAKNHCCATMVTNFILQGYAGNAAPGRQNIRIGDRKDPACVRKLFREIHRFVGNGPVFTLRGANRYLFRAGYSCRFHRIPRSRLHSVLVSGVPAALLVAASPFDWHWVLAIGLSEKGHIQIINNWDRDTWKTLPTGQSARILSVWIPHPGPASQ